MDYLYFLLNKMTRAPYALKCDVIGYTSAVMEYIMLQRGTDLQRRWACLGLNGLWKKYAIIVLKEILLH